MRIYITRHGQPDLEQEAWSYNPDIPLCDPVLTRKGRKQAICLGQFLRQKNFNGLIISSPYRRTLETAQLIAEQTNSLIQTEAAIQEVVYKAGYPDFEGLDIKQIQELYGNVSDKNILAHPWFSCGPEDMEDVKKRVAPFINELIRSNNPNAQILLVGHGASVHACKELLIGKFFDKSLPEKHNWNCSLSTYIFDEMKSLKEYELFDIKHMPEAIITSNKRVYCGDMEYAV